MRKLLAGKGGALGPGSRYRVRRFRLPRLWNLSRRQVGNAAISATPVSEAPMFATPWGQGAEVAIAKRGENLAAAYPCLESCKTSRTIWLV
jgi:hypothetical protein